MLCSGTELGLNEDLYPGAGYNGLLVLPEDAEVGADVKPLLQLVKQTLPLILRHISSSFPAP